MLLVRERDLDRALALLAEIAAEDAEDARLRVVEAERPPIRGGLAAVAAILLVCTAVLASLHLHGPPSAADYLAHGAITWTRVEQGEHWRWITAIFVHFGASHLLSNALVLILVGPPLAAALGPWRFLLVFLATGVAGNAASHFLAPSLALKGGASGAIAGALGALAGHQLRPDRRSRYRAWQVLGALAAIFALVVGTGPNRDDAAHFGGLLAGLLLGRLVPPPRRRRPRPPGEPAIRGAREARPGRTSGAPGPGP